jgi:hypothetical protein
MPAEAWGECSGRCGNRIGAPKAGGPRCRLSKFDHGVAVHYNDQVGVKTAMLSQGGEPVRYFSDKDEIWVPFGEGDKLVTDGPRYSGEALPNGVECDCVRTAIDAALEAAGFQGWMTASELVQVAYRKDHVWQRLGVTK